MFETVRPPIVNGRGKKNLTGMSASTPLQLLPEDKLDILRDLDEFHFWHSLDDERRCRRCGKSITGRQILIVELQGTRGKLRMQCPTAGCVSSPSEWVYANPVLAAKLRMNSHLSVQKLNVKSGPARRPHHGHAGTVQRAKRALERYGGAIGWTNWLSPVHKISFRAVLGRLALLRPLATGLRAIHPVF
jgi:hypothetical protein